MRRRVECTWSIIAIAVQILTKIRTYKRAAICISCRRSPSRAACPSSSPCITAPCPSSPRPAACATPSRPYNPETGEGRGFTFQSYNADDFLGAIDRAAGLYYGDRDAWNRLARHDMECDFSWQVPANEYMQLYSELLYGKQ